LESEFAVSEIDPPAEITPDVPGAWLVVVSVTVGKANVREARALESGLLPTNQRFA